MQPSKHEIAVAQRLDRPIWTLIAAVAVTVAAAPLVSTFEIAWRTFLVPGSACLALAAAGWFYRRWRTDARLSAALGSTAQLVAFAAVGAPLSYLAASANLPLHDGVLDAIDHALGLDWTALLGWLNGQNAVYTAFRLVYMSLTLQMTAAVLGLAFSGKLVWLRVYMLAFIFAALVTIAVSAVLPAVGVWPHLGLSAAQSPHILPAVNTSWPVFYGLRDGSVRTLVAVGSEGIITFPSLHAALAVLLIAAMWPVRMLRWPILLINLVMLAATPIDGSHYFIDVIAGVALTVPCLAVARTMAAQAGRAPVLDRASKISPLTAGE